ncbi:MAG: ABC transporter permease [Verrucomicrobia bacterium]|nr:ABC transporter permease [Kiritimatiellia bacterium]MCO6399707.1 ABC transporter permease [Verrucomicrobiota bacterium]
MTLISAITRHRELLWNLAARELKLRYRGSALGFFWSVLIPLFMALIYVIFLRLLGGRGVPLADVIIGVFAWQFTVQCINAGLTSITGNANLVKKVAFPRLILPLSATLANAITYVMSLLVQFPLVAILFHTSGQHFSPWIILLPVVLLVHLIFNLALTLLLAGLNVVIRDAQHLVGILLSAWFFVSPVMYNLDFVTRHAEAHPWAPKLFLLNPMTVIVTGYRSVITRDVPFPFEPMSYISLALIGLLFVYSYRLFQRLQKDFADLL